MEVECAYLSELNSEEIFHRLKRKVEQNEKLADEELMEFIIYPLSYRTKEEKQENIRKTVELATCIKDRSQQLFTLAGILAFTDKIIDHEAANQIRRVIEMTQVAQIFEEEKRQALIQAAQIYEEEKRQTAQIYEKEKRQTAQIYEEEKQQAEKQAAKTAYRKVVIRMIQKDYSTEEISSLVSAYSQDDIEELRRELQAEKN